MNPDLLHTLGLATAAITVATTGAVVLVLHLLFCPELDKEIEDDLRRRPQ
jgi:hypothetical protein